LPETGTGGEIGEILTGIEYAITCAIKVDNELLVEMTAPTAVENEFHVICAECAMFVKSTDVMAVFD
jgi:hypothetical protein